MRIIIGRKKTLSSGIIRLVIKLFTKKPNAKTISEIKTKTLIVYTSGLGGLFKPGIPVGKVYNNLNNRINFFSDFGQLDYVKIVSYDIGGEN